MTTSVAAHWKPSEADREVLLGLKAEQDKAGSQAAFCREFLPFSEGKWSRIIAVVGNNGDGGNASSYFDSIDHPDRLMAELRSLLEEIRVQSAMAESRKAIDIVRLKKHEAVMKAVRECKGKLTSERMVVNLAPTGGGKTILCQRLQDELGGRVIEARPTWRKKYSVFLGDVCRGVGCRLDGETDPAEMELKLITFAKGRQILLVLDEAEYFGAETINGVKLLLNKTRFVIVLNAIAAAYDRWNRYYPVEAEQLARRTHARFELTAVEEADVSLFFPNKKQFDEREAALAMICGEASKFGHYSLVRRVADRLADHERADEKQVKAALAAARREMVRDLTEVGK